MSSQDIYKTSTFGDMQYLKALFWIDPLMFATNRFLLFFLAVAPVSLLVLAAVAWRARRMKRLEYYCLLEDTADWCFPPALAAFLIFVIANSMGARNVIDLRTVLNHGSFVVRESDWPDYIRIEPNVAPRSASILGREASVRTAGSYDLPLSAAVKIEAVLRREGLVGTSALLVDVQKDRKGADRSGRI